MPSSDNNSHTVYVLGLKYIWALLRAHFNPRLTAPAKMCLSRAKNIFMPANINSIVLSSLSSFFSILWFYSLINMSSFVSSSKYRKCTTADQSTASSQQIPHSSPFPRTELVSRPGLGGNQNCSAFGNAIHARWKTGSRFKLGSKPC